MPRPASFSIFVHRALNRSLPYCTTTSHMLSYEHRSPALAQMSLHDFLPWRRSRSCGLLLRFFALARRVHLCYSLRRYLCAFNHGHIRILRFVGRADFRLVLLFFEKVSCVKPSTILNVLCSNFAKKVAYPATF